MGNRTNGHTLALTVTAGLAGAAVALLFAPRSGRETRAKLRNTTSDFKEKADRKMSSARDSLHDGLEQARDLKRRVIHKAKSNDRPEPDKALSAKSAGPLSSWEEEI